MLSTKVSKILVGWAIVTSLGIGGFVIAKNAIERERRESMKVRERMRNANTGDYEVKRKFTG